MGRVVATRWASAVIASDVDIKSIRQGIPTEMPFAKGARRVARALDLMSPGADLRIENIDAWNVLQLSISRLPLATALTALI